MLRFFDNLNPHFRVENSGLGHQKSLACRPKISFRNSPNRGREYCGKPDHHAFQLYLGIEDIDHSKTKANHPQTNGICERFYRTMQDECYTILFRKKLYHSLEEIDIDEWLRKYNHDRPRSGRFCFGKTPYKTFQDAMHIAFEKSPHLLLHNKKEVHTEPVPSSTSDTLDTSYN